MLGHDDLVWKGDALFQRGSRKQLLQIVPDEKYPGIMWRVEYPDGQLSDMVNRSRAKDAGKVIALGILNKRPTI